MKKNTEHFNLAIAIQIIVFGRVQGVGFRPFVYRLAKIHSLTGYVFNRPDGVIIRIEGEKNAIRKFLSDLKSKKPFAAKVKKTKIEQVTLEGLEDFVILKSENSGNTITEICPDIAVCPECREELFSPGRRNNYPFINCTNCGPRFTIFDGFPYDRPNTSMKYFAMCPPCETEYHDPLDRRFHAQPIACPDCGPVYIYHKNGQTVSDLHLALDQLSKDINNGKTAAIKSLGGYNLICDATKADAVAEIRKFKLREKKPFALMFRSLKHLEQIADVGDTEKQTLNSWQRPIVILPLKSYDLLPEGITSGLNTVGAFLPYLPLHYLLFEKLNTNILVMTSGNCSEEPILSDDEQALSAFSSISGGVVTNNRSIYNRIDDSVVRVIAKIPSLIRRARGYVPAPVDLGFEVTGILAAGAELSNCFCLGKGKQGIFSQHIGDLKNAETYAFYRENIERFTTMYQQPVTQIACDLHPDYLSTRSARETDLPIIEVQHHHAHCCSVMAEHNLEDPVIGIAYDGTGLGTDGHIWGSELMIAGYTNFERLSHFEYIPLPGGDKAVKEPWRSAVSYLHHTLGAEFVTQKLPFLRRIDPEHIQFIIEAIEKNINAPLCCSAGRLFDAVAALLDICTESGYHAEAPLLLENYIDPEIQTFYTFSGEEIISFAPMFKEILNDITQKVSLREIVTRFHNTVALAIEKQVKYATSRSGITTVVLSGGTFQNKYLTEKIVFLLERNNFDIYLPQEIPANDGGIALGQMAVAAHKISIKQIKDKNS